MDAIAELRLEGNPGYPHNTQFSTNAKLLEEYGNRIVDIVAERLKLWCQPELMNWDPTQLVQFDYHDPVAVFIKNEPHSLKKVREKRWRCIFGIGVIDQLCERVLLRSIVQAFESPTETGVNCGSMVKLGFSDELASCIGKHYHDRLKRFPDCKPVSTDVKNWDGTVSTEMMSSVVEILTAGASTQWAIALRNWCYMTTNVLYALPGGIIVKREGKSGMMPSGSFGTTYFNTLMRVMLSAEVGGKSRMAMGDDCIDFVPFSVEQLIHNYAQHGVEIHDVETPGHHAFTFCSHYFMCQDPANETWICALATWKKAINRFLTKGNRGQSGEEFHAVQYELRHNPPEVVNLLLKVFAEHLQ